MKIIKLQDDYFINYYDKCDCSKFIEINDKDFDLVKNILDAATEEWLNEEINQDEYQNELDFLITTLTNNNINFEYIDLKPDYIVNW